ncbi:immunoglobulin-like domain-containing protein [Aureicoccus marinus]|uniref:BIG2 domain-containing protein n=1 Tax=Aureicoccus marinus TaxID=754435 RepID=A0A2S7T6B7_9FLAO|nr:immunoglobulin-like domain-containing protein [Aureicoccus marinus]PQJ15214.1 hypothetical protein BST99_05250 [Aureicoccus marinus]
MEAGLRGMNAGRGDFNLIKDTEVYSQIDNGNPLDYYFYTFGSHTKFLRARAIRNVGSDHSGHGICFNQGGNKSEYADRSMAEDCYVYGTNVHFDGSYGCIVKDTKVITQPYFGGYIQGTQLNYPGGGVIFIEDAEHNLVEGGVVMNSFAFQDSNDGKIPTHTSEASAGQFNTIFGVTLNAVNDIRRNGRAMETNFVWFHPWSGSTLAKNNLFENNVVNGVPEDNDPLILIERPNSNNIFRNNVFNNWDSGLREQEDATLNSNTQFHNNIWNNSTAANNDARENFIYSDGSSNGIPVISLYGSPAIQLEIGDNFEDPGASAFDPEDGNISSQIEVSGSVDTSQEGEYTLRYNVTDSDGNTANEVSRTVTIDTSSDNGGGDDGGGEDNGGLSVYLGNQAMFTPVMIDSIKRRFESGWTSPKANAFNDDFALMIEKSNDFNQNPDINEWDNFTAINGVLTNDSAPTPQFGVRDEIHFAALHAFILRQFPESSQQASILSNKVANKILAYARSQNQPAGLDSEGIFTSPYMFIALRLCKLIDSYYLVEGISNLSNSEKTEIENWFRNWHFFFKQQHDFVNSTIFGPNWINGDYRLTDWVSNPIDPNQLRTNPINGRIANTAQQAGLNNVRAHIADFVHLGGLYFNDSEAKQMSFEWFKMLLRFNHYSDGTSAEMVRANISNQQQGLGYTGINLTAVMKMALSHKVAEINDLAGATNGDEYFEYSTSEGFSSFSTLNGFGGTDTAGGIKSLISIVKNFFDYSRMNGGQGHQPPRVYEGTTVNAAGTLVNFTNGELMDRGSDMNHRPLASILDLYYNDEEVSAAVINDASYGYTQSGLTTGSTGGYPYGLNGAWNTFLGMIYYTNIEGAFDQVGVSDPNDGQNGDDNIEARGITVTPSFLNLNVGDAFQLIADVQPSNASNRDVIWRTSNSNIVQVDNTGLITCISPGNVTIRVISVDQGFEAEAEISVYQNADFPYSITVIGFESQELITTLANNSVLPSYLVEGKEFGILADFDRNDEIASVDFRLEGPLNHQQRQRLFPWSLFGDTGGVVFGREFPLGNYSLNMLIEYENGEVFNELMQFEILEMDPNEDGGDSGNNNNEDDIGYDIALAPNPAISNVQLRFPFVVDEVDLINVYSLSGRKVFSIVKENFVKLDDFSVLLTTESLSRGIYLVTTISLNYGDSYSKLIKM